MLYQSKKDETIYAKVLKENEKSKTLILEYTTGEKAGKNFDISSATLKRWWRKVEDESVVEEPVVEEQKPEEEEPEIFKVIVEDEETGQKRTVEINPDELDIETNPDDFNVPYEEKQYIPVPESVKKYARDFIFEYTLASGEPYPDIEEVVDKCVEWGAEVKRYGGFITLTNKTKILFRRNSREILKSVFEVRMLEEVSKKVKSLEVVEEPLKSAMCKGVDFVVRASSMAELETLIREISL